MKSASASEIKAAFGEAVRRVPCPQCSTPFSDAALAWGEAWQEGRRDLMRELRRDERDGPYKLRCDVCGSRAWLNYLAMTATRADQEPSGDR